MRDRNRYLHLTAALMASISADEVAIAIGQHVDLRIEAAGGNRDAAIDALPTGTRAVYATSLVDSEVNAGGFNQFFFNQSARRAGQALAGYELLGAEDYAAVMRAAIATHEAERPRMMPYYDAGSLEALRASYEITDLGEIDQRYYALGDRIYNVWAGFAKARPELFEG